MTAPAIWQEVEFGSYTADLPVWVEIAAEATGPILELGAGAGRVALHLAEHGHEVIAAERDPELVAELDRSAAGERPRLTVVRADLSSPAELALPIRPALAIAPLHLIQLLDDSARVALLARLRDLLAPGATLAAAVVDEPNLLSAGVGSTQILPDMREVDGWVYSSQPLWIQVAEDALSVRRVRERVSPDGAMERFIHDELVYRISPERLEREAEDAGLLTAGRRQVESGDREADSIVVLLEVPR